MEKQLVLWLFMLLMTINSSGQEEYDYSRFLEIDYLTYEYKYLDKDLNIIATPEQFSNWIIEYGFFENRITRYKDSLLVVLTGEFGNKRQASIATRRITFSWLRAGYYLWLSEDEAMKLGNELGFSNPYRFYEYFHKQTHLWNDTMKAFMNELKLKVQTETNNAAVGEMDNKIFFRYALAQNPQRIKDYVEYKNNLNSNSECNEPNCCQNQDSNKEPCDSLANSQ